MKFQLLKNRLGFPIIQIVAPLISIFLFSCDNVFQYNPNQIVLNDAERDLNAKNMAKIQQVPPSDTTRFILVGDTQRWYDETKDFVKSANQQKDIGFIIHSGDISDFGLTWEFKWINNLMQNLDKPYLTVIGNHDIVANGADGYVRMFGPMNYTMDYGRDRFIFLNTNSREYAFDGSTPDLALLKRYLSSNTENRNVILVGHVPPFDADFDPKMEKEYASILAKDPNIKFTLYGHQHAFKEGEFYEDGVEYYLTTSTGARGYLIISTWAGGYNVKRVTY